MRAWLRLAVLAVLALPASAGAAETSVTYLRGGPTETADLYLWAASPDYGGRSNTLYTGLVGAAEKRSLLYFALDLPARSRVVSANLVLKVSGASGQVVRAHRITAPWELDAACWKTVGNAFDPEVAGLAPVVPTDTHRISLDLRRLVQSWVDGEFPNYGVVLEENPTRASSYYSSRSSDPAFFPRLEVVYEAPLHSGGSGLAGLDFMVGCAQGSGPAAAWPAPALLGLAATLLRRRRS